MSISRFWPLWAKEVRKESTREYFSSSQSETGFCPDSASLCKHVAAALYGVGARLDRDPTHFFRLRKIELNDLVSQAVKEEAEKLLQVKGAGESVLMDEGDDAFTALFGIDLSDAGEKRIPAGPVMQVKTNRPAATKSNGKASGKASEMSFRHSPEPDRQPRTKENSPTRKDQNPIQDALQALEILSGKILRLESDLKALLK